MMVIHLHGPEAKFEPLSPLEFEVEWRDLERCEGILVNVFWRVVSSSKEEGTDGAVVVAEEIEGVGREGSRRLRLPLPEGPYSFQGEHFSIEWGIEAIAMPTLEFDRKRFVLGPKRGIEGGLNAVSEPDLSFESKEKGV